MRHLRTFSLLAAALFLIAGCGSSSSPNLSGNWLGTATSNSGGGNNPVQFTFTMQEGALAGNSAPITISNLTFTNANNCFANGSTASGTVTNGVNGGARTLTGDVFSGANNTGNHLNFNMQVATDNNSASGTYTTVGGNGGCPGQDAGSVTFVRQ